MFDLYSAEKDSTAPDGPIENNHLASFSIEEFKELRQLFEIAGENGIRISYFDDLLLSPVQVKLLLDILKSATLIIDRNCTVKIKVYKKLEDILAYANDNDLGIVGFCD